MTDEREKLIVQASGAVCDLDIGIKARHVPVVAASIARSVIIELVDALRDTRSPAKACTWTEDDDGIWETLCRNAFYFEDGGPSENGANFCCYCGGPIVEVFADELLVEYICGKEVSGGRCGLKLGHHGNCRSDAAYDMTLETVNRATENSADNSSEESNGNSTTSGPGTLQVHGDGRDGSSVGRAAGEDDAAVRRGGSAGGRGVQPLHAERESGDADQQPATGGLFRSGEGVLHRHHAGGRASEVDGSGPDAPTGPGTPRDTSEESNG